MKRKNKNITICLGLIFTLLSVVPTTAETPPETPAPGSAMELPPPDITAPSAVVLDAETGVIVYEKNKDQRNYPASTTKVLTALLTLEQANGNYTQRIPFSKEAIYSIPYNSSHIAMNVGDTLSIEEALYGILLASANEVSNALAEYFGGDVAGFADMMNARAKELGAVNSHFINPNGLHDNDHYTTAYDMALFMREAVEYPEFLKVISTTFYEIPPTETQPEKRPLNNSDKMIQPGKYYDEAVVGGKTGFTDQAMHPLVTYGKQDDIGLIVVVMHDESPAAAYNDTAALLAYGFQSYEDSVAVLDKADACYVPFDMPGVSAEPGVVSAFAAIGGGLGAGRSVGTAGDTRTFKIVPAQDVNLLLPLSAVRRVKVETNILKNLSTPILKGQNVGLFRVICDGMTLATVPALADENIDLPTEAKIENTNQSENNLPPLSSLTALLKNHGSTLLIFAAAIFSVLAVCIGMLRAGKKERIWRGKQKRTGDPRLRNYRYR